MTGNIRDMHSAPFAATREYPLRDSFRLTTYRYRVVPTMKWVLMVKLPFCNKVKP